MAGPLAGVRVLDFSQIIAGPLCGMLLADMGAEVVKIEPLGGEPWRSASQFIPGESKVFIALNRGKQSLPLDLDAPESRAIVAALVRDADVVLLNYRPDVPARIGLDYETLSAINPRLIYCENTAFGRQGPDAYRPGYDNIIQAMSGLMAANNIVRDGILQPATPAPADFSTGLMMAYGVALALLARQRTGRGQRVEASLLATALTIQTLTFTSIDSLDADWQAQFRQGLQAARARGASWDELTALRAEVQPTRVQGNIYYRVFKTRDAYLAVGCLNAALRRKLLTVLHLHDPALDDPFVDLRDPAIVAERMRLVETAEALFAEKTTAEWLRILDGAGVPAGPVRFIEELLDDPQALANDLVVELEHPLAGHLRMPGLGLRLSDTPGEVGAASPTLGQDTDTILQRLGYDEAAIADLRARGVTQ